MLALLLLLTWLGGGLPAGAQPAAGAPLDSAAALAKLFAGQRRLNRGQVASGLIAVVGINYGLSFSKLETRGQQVRTGLSAGLLGLYGHRLVRALIRQRRYRPAREQKLLASLARGEPLPRRLRQKLTVGAVPPRN